MGDRGKFRPDDARSCMANAGLEDTRTTPLSRLTTRKAIHSLRGLPAFGSERIWSCHRYQTFRRLQAGMNPGSTP